MFNGKKVIVLVQARCTSTRLPKKHFRNIGNKMMIDWIVDKLKDIKEIDEIIISSTNEISDLPLKEYAKNNEISFYGYSGNVDDVVGRHYNAVKNKDADYVVVISGDCPLIDEKLIQQQLNMLEQGNDYTRPSTVCIHEGIDSYSMNCINFLNENSKTMYERENFGVIVRENLNLVKVGFIDIGDKYTQNIFRISVDNMADLRFMNELYEKLKIRDKAFNIENALELAKKDKTLLDINLHVEQKKKNEPTYKFLIKTEASQEKGLGHLKRMMALGQYLNENKNNGVFYAINEDDTSKSTLDEKGYIYDYKFAETEEDLIKILIEHKSDILIIDVQKLEGSTNYNFKNIKDLTGIKKIILIDKYVEDDFVDLMLIQGIQSDKFEEKVKGNDKVLYGLECVFINHDFIKSKEKRMKSKIDTKYKEIVISFGGSDPNNLTSEIIGQLNEIELNFKVNFKIILGPYYQGERALKKRLRSFKYRYVIVSNPSNYANELSDCNYAIIAYGSTFYEFLYMGIPTINYPIHKGDQNIIDLIYRDIFNIDYKGLSDINRFSDFKLNDYNLSFGFNELYKRISEL